MDKIQLMTILPHRGSMLLLDSAYVDETGIAIGTYHARGDEWFFDGHFPGNPVMPGVIQCEIIAQASCVLFADQLSGKTAYYAGMDKVRFRRMVKPGETLTIKSELIRSKMNLFVMRGQASVGDEVCASGEFSFIIPE